MQDYEFVKGSGDLDECNGRKGVTPEFAGGTYYYVVTEAAHLLKESPAAVQSLLAKISVGDLVILPLTRDDAQAIGQIIATFRDQDTDFADACLVHLADREAISTVFTVDRRHFTVYRTAAGRALSLIPE